MPKKKPFRILSPIGEDNVANAAEAKKQSPCDDDDEKNMDELFDVDLGPALEQNSHFEQIHFEQIHFEQKHFEQNSFENKDDAKGPPSSVFTIGANKKTTKWQSERSRRHVFEAEMAWETYLIKQNQRTKMKRK